MSPWAFLLPSELLIPFITNSGELGLVGRSAVGLDWAGLDEYLASSIVVGTTDLPLQTLSIPPYMRSRGVCDSLSVFG